MVGATGDGESDGEPGNTDPRKRIHCRWCFVFTHREGPRSKTICQATGHGAASPQARPATHSIATCRATCRASCLRHWAQMLCMYGQKEFSHRINVSASDIPPHRSLFRRHWQGATVGFHQRRIERTASLGLFASRSY